MIKQDTIRLLRECDAGIKMGVSSIADVLPRVQDGVLLALLKDCRIEHEKLGNEAHRALNRFGEEGKSPNLMAKTMSSVKTNLEMMVNPTDAAIADLMTDGCNMGVKSLSKYLNQYTAADESAKELCKRLIRIEDQLVHDVRRYL